MSTMLARMAIYDGETKRLKAYEKKMLASPDQQISLIDPNSRQMATIGRGSGVIGYKEGEKAMRRYWTTACDSFPLKKKCITGSERRIKRSGHEHVLKGVLAYNLTRVLSIISVKPLVTAIRA